MASEQETEAQGVSAGLSRKLQALYDSLTDEEKAHLRSLLTRRSREDDVSGFSLGGEGKIRYPFPPRRPGSPGPTVPEDESEWGIVEIEF
jgi:hypothetical protein